ncbi:MAG: ATP-binding region ATPase domain-containing protein [Acidimicrobiaceae bacterium]|nr:MAG: ATP-binding region ATPase domain-containing protein [Acidimicrobiaceae bacterium]
MGDDDQIDSAPRAHDLPLAASGSARSATPGPVGAAARPDTAPVTAPLWPFRILALLGASVQGRDQFTSDNWQLWAAMAAATVYTIFIIVRPIAHRDDLRVRFRVVLEQALITALVMLTGGWLSPLALCLIPSAMVAGFSAGTIFAAQLASSTVVVVSVQHLTETDPSVGARDVVLWAALIGTVVFTSGLSQRASADAARQREAANVRVSRLAEANSLLFALQRVAQSMPASLDLDEVVDSTFKRVSSLVQADTVALYLLNETDRRLELFRNIGSVAPPMVQMAALPAAIRPAIESPRTVRSAHLPPGGGLSLEAASAVYSGLRARGSLLGLLAIECDRPDALTQQHSEIVHGLAEAFGIAIDNARLFRQIRAASANEERARIARDLHDHIGSSLAFLGFEVDRAQELAARGSPVGPVLGELRDHLTGVINEIRETLHDLRTDVTDERDLAAVLGDHLARVRSRGTLDARCQVETEFRPPRPVEREIWQIALEAITNVERHARASYALVEYSTSRGHVFLRITDDGVGLNSTSPPTDRYGMVGMRERAARIDATLRVEPAAGGGTIVTLELQTDEAAP